jgi:hypothetical protein
MADDNDLEQWWNRLSPSTRKQLRVDPSALIPPELIDELRHAGRSIVAIQWRATPQGLKASLAPNVSDWVGRLSSDEQIADHPS